MAKKKKSSSRKSKKQKLNTRLLLIIMLVLFGIGAGGGGAYWYFTKGRVEINISTGDEAAASGNHRTAVKYYGRVLYRSPDHEEALAKLISSYEQIVPITREEAEQYYGARFTALLARANAHKSTADDFQPVIDEVMYAAMATNLERYWTTLQGLCDRATGRFAPSEPIYSTALLYKGFCELRLRDGEMTDDIREDGYIAFPGEKELEEHLELNPDSDEGRAAIAFGRLAVARRLELEGRIGQASKNLRIAEESYEEALRRNPNGVATAIMVLRDLVIREIIQNNNIQNDKSSVSDAEVDALKAGMASALNHAESIVMADPGSMPLKVQDLLQWYKRADREAGVDRAVAMLEAYLSEHPDDLRMQLALADTYYAAADSESARSHATQVLDAPQLPISLMSLQQFGLKRSACALLFEVEYRVLNQSEPDEQEANLATVLEVRELLGVHLDNDDENPIALRADARIAMATNEYRKAATLFERLIFLGGNLPGSVYRNAAYCLIEIGQTGLALERISTALEVEPMQLGHYLAKAAMQGRLRMPEEGIRTLESLPPGIQIDNEEVADAMQALELLSASQNRVSIDLISDPVLRAIGSAERASRIGDNSEAIAVLLNAINAEPEPDVRLLAALAQMYNYEGDSEKAVASVDRAIELEPDNQRLRSMRMMYETNDPVSMVRAELEAMYPDDPDAFEESFFLTMHQMQLNQSRKAEEYTKSGRHLNAELASNLVKKAQAELDLLHSRVMANGMSKNPGLFAIQFEEALQESQWDMADELVEFGTQQNIDEANGQLLVARYRLAQHVEAIADGDMVAAREFATQAALAARQATEISTWSDAAWLALAMSLEAAGNEDEALAAYEQAYRRNPTNPRTARNYSGLLLRQGEASSRAIGVLKTTYELMPTDGVIREAWLAAEEGQGNLKQVLQTRYAILRSQKFNRLNTLQLAKLLSVLEPRRELIINEYGEEQIPDRQWMMLSDAQRQQAVDSQADTWARAVGEMLVTVEQNPDTTLQQALIHAEVYKNLDRRTEAARIVADYINANVDDPNYVPNVLAAANFLLQSDRAREGVAMLKSALPKQDDATRPIDIALGQLYEAVGDDREALRYLQVGYEATGSPALRRMVIGALIRLNRFEQAQAAIEEMIGSAPPAYEHLIVLADLTKQQAAMAGSQGDGASQSKATASHRQWLEQANQIDASKLQPYLDLIDSFLVEYATSRESQLLNQARFIAEKGIEVRPDSDTLVVKRVDILEAQGNLAEAVLDLESMLRKYADSDMLRDRLVIAYLKSGQQAKAEAILSDVIALYPTEGRWHEALGDFYQSLPEKNLVSATASYLRAYKLSPARRTLVKLRTVTRGGERWDYDAMISLIQASGMAASSDPQMIGLYARAYAGKGAFDRADTQLKRAYPLLVNGIDRGDLPEMSVRQWYEDLYAVYANREPEQGATLAASVIGDGGTYWDSVGISTYWALYGERGYAQAIAEQQKAVDRSVTEAPEMHTTMLNLLGSYQIANGEPELAAQTFKSIIEEYPKDAGALNNYAYIIATSLGRAGEALPYAQRAIAIEPRSVDILDTISTIHALLGEHEKSMVSRLRHHTLQPDNVEVVLEISRSYMSHYEDAEKALKFAELASKIMPKDPEVMGTLGWSYYRTGESNLGEEMLRSSIKLGPTPRAHLYMAQVFIDQSQLGKARTHLQTGLDLSPDLATREEIERIQDDIGSS